MRHFLKLNQRFADPVYNGDKRFEIRYNDRAFQKGDEVKFTVVDDNGIETKSFWDKGRREYMTHPLESMTFEISYVLSGWGLKNGYVVPFNRNPSWLLWCY